MFSKTRNKQILIHRILFVRAFCFACMSGCIALHVGRVISFHHTHSHPSRHISVSLFIFILHYPFLSPFYSLALSLSVTSRTCSVCLEGGLYFGSNQSAQCKGGGAGWGGSGGFTITWPGGGGSDGGGGGASCRARGETWSVSVFWALHSGQVPAQHGQVFPPQCQFGFPWQLPVCRPHFLRSWEVPTRRPEDLSAGATSLPEDLSALGVRGRCEESAGATPLPDHVLALAVRERCEDRWTEGGLTSGCPEQ